MKKLFFSAVAAVALLTANAETFNLEGPMPTLKKEWRDGSMTGKTPAPARSTVSFIKMYGISGVWNPV